MFNHYLLKTRKTYLLLFLIAFSFLYSSCSYALADDSDSPSNSFESKLAQKLNIDENILSNAIKEVRDEMFSERKENIKLKMQSMIDSGEITQEEAEEADEKIEYMMSGKGKRWHLNKGHKKMPSEEEMREKMQSMIDSGKITQEEADEKIEYMMSGKGKRGWRK